MRYLITLALLVPVAFGSSAQITRNDNLLFGAEIFIEPGQNANEIEQYFKVLSETGMNLTRIRLTENFMRRSDGTWDFALFDHAFRMGEKYNVKIYANLFPATNFNNIGGFKFPKSDQHLADIAQYTRIVVSHFKSFSSCYGWVPINEPGLGRMPGDEYSKQRFVEWKISQSRNLVLDEFIPFDLDEYRFLLQYNSWYLTWLVDQIRQYDQQLPIHVNTHAIFSNVAEYDFPAWRTFLTSLGGSAHASWHFGYFQRSEYALAVSANSEIIRSGAGEIPWLMTELQGGVNTYSGIAPMSPTDDEIVQWMWLVLATEGKGVIFWCLNPRASGKEAGEWAMLDYSGQVTSRINAAKSVVQCVRKNELLLSNARVLESGINIIYIREALWMEAAQQTGNGGQEGRRIGGVMKSALSYFKALSELGVQANLKEISEFDFSQPDYRNKVIIIPHQIVIPRRCTPLLEKFVKKGGKLIIDGLTGYYDENGICTHMRPGKLDSLLGGRLRELVLPENGFKVRVGKHEWQARLWKGRLRASTGTAFAFSGGDTVGIRHNVDLGETVWLSTMFGFSARESSDRSFSNWLQSELRPVLELVPVRLTAPAPGIIMKTLQTQSGLVSVLVNKSTSLQRLALQTDDIYRPHILFNSKGGIVSARSVKIRPEETIVVQWTKMK